LLALRGTSGALAQEARHDAGSEHASVEALLVELAHTPAAHAALADYYRGKAAEARATAETHRSMGKHYAASKFFEREAMSKHCKALAKQFERMAAQYEELASSHAAEAKH
jgi:hypothetical protein